MNTKIKIKDNAEIRIIGSNETVKVIMTTDKNGTKFLNIDHSPTVLIKNDPRDIKHNQEKWFKYFCSY